MNFPQSSTLSGHGLVQCAYLVINLTVGVAFQPDVRFLHYCSDCVFKFLKYKDMMFVDMCFMQMGFCDGKFQKICIAKQQQKYKKHQILFLCFWSDIVWIIWVSDWCALKWLFPMVSALFSSVTSLSTTSFSHNDYLIISVCMFICPKIKKHKFHFVLRWHMPPWIILVNKVEIDIVAFSFSPQFHGDVLQCAVWQVLHQADVCLLSQLGAQLGVQEKGDHGWNSWLERWHH